MDKLNFCNSSILCRNCGLTLLTIDSFIKTIICIISKSSSIRRNCNYTLTHRIITRSHLRRLIHTSHKLNSSRLNVGVNHIQCISRSSGLICIIAIELCGNGICSIYSWISHSTILRNTYAPSCGSYFIYYPKTIGVYKFCSIESTLSNVCSITILGEMDACILAIVHDCQLH